MKRRKKRFQAGGFVTPMDWNRQQQQLQMQAAMGNLGAAPPMGAAPQGAGAAGFNNLLNQQRLQGAMAQVAGEAPPPIPAAAGLPQAPLGTIGDINQQAMQQAAAAQTPGLGWRGALRNAALGGAAGVPGGGAGMLAGVGAGLAAALAKKRVRGFAEGGHVCHCQEQAEEEERAPKPKRAVRMAAGGAAKERRGYPKTIKPPGKKSEPPPLSGKSIARGMGKATRGHKGF